MHVGTNVVDKNLRGKDCRALSSAIAGGDQGICGRVCIFIARANGLVPTLYFCCLQTLVRFSVSWYYLFIMWTAGCRSMLLRKCTGGEDLALAAGGGGRARKTGRGTSSIRSIWLLETSFHAFIWILCSFIMFLVFDAHATLSDGK